MMETTISDFRTSFYIPAIQKLDFHLPHVRILGINHCGAIKRTAFIKRELFQYFLCRRDYADRVVASFADKIKSEYYVGNRSVSIDGIALEHFSAVPQADINSSTISLQCHAVVRSFLSYDSKQDAATATAHSKRFISLLKYKKVLTTSLSTKCKNTYGCAKQYICASVLYLFSLM